MAAVRTKRRKRIKTALDEDDYEYDYSTQPQNLDGDDMQSDTQSERDPAGLQTLLSQTPAIRAQALHQGPDILDDINIGAQMVELPRTVEVRPAGAPEVSKFSKRKRKARHGRIKVFQDAANSCQIEVDNDGNILSVMLTDDLNNTFLQFGQETYGETDPIQLQENRHNIAQIAKKKPFVRDTPRTTKAAGQHIDFGAWETVGGMGQSKKYKKVKLKKTKLRSKKAKVELLFAADKADLVVDEYTDKIGKVYVAFPDAANHKTYLFKLPQKLNVITEEFSREIPIRRAAEDRADWYVQDTSSEESYEEPDVKPIMHEMAMEAVDQVMPGPGIGFAADDWDGPETRMVLE